jgi:hypothetical protein
MSNISRDRIKSTSSNDIYLVLNSLLMIEQLHLLQILRFSGDVDVMRSRPDASRHNLISIKSIGSNTVQH